ncbi:zinc finger protein ZIC 5-like [Oppia nitens]|uniref:zinc finger protein ZIC 5-like n=1 Tax=Oppia nitens TaxID=1686743 RepID=UPI0023DB9A5D|nr:zinc finger protein ZIC 5-like [Oppia nitens]
MNEEEIIEDKRVNHKFTLQERIELIKIFYSGKSLKQTVRVFAERHPDCPHMPTSSGITRLVRKFETTGSVLDKRIPGRPKTSRGVQLGVQQPELVACAWPGCSYMSNKKCLARHKLVHKTERDYLCPWVGCDKGFKSSLSLKNHLRIHNEDKRYACNWPGCQYRCVDSGNIRKHKKIHEKQFRGLLKTSDVQNKTQMKNIKTDLLSDNDYTSITFE